MDFLFSLGSTVVAKQQSCILLCFEYLKLACLFDFVILTWCAFASCTATYSNQFESGQGFRLPKWAHHFLGSELWVLKFLFEYEVFCQYFLDLLLSRLVVIFIFSTDKPEKTVTLVYSTTIYAFFHYTLSQDLLC